MDISARLRLEVAHTVVYVHDVEKMIAFYSEVLGFEVADRGPIGPNEIVFLSQIANHHHQLALITGRPDPENSNSIHHTAYRSAGTLDDLRALLGDALLERICERVRIHDVMHQELAIG